jgi:CRP-like cAMP-binding protein
LIDCCLQFFVAYSDDDDNIVIDRVAIAKRYLWFYFWIDFIPGIPGP